MDSRGWYGHIDVTCRPHHCVWAQQVKIHSLPFSHFEGLKESLCDWEQIGDPMLLLGEVWV